MFGGLLVLLILIAIYFAPSMVASQRHHPATATFALNVLLGWTFIGWVMALVWALANEPTAAR
jgi:hypothetical protein